MQSSGFGTTMALRLLSLVLLLVAEGLGLRVSGVLVPRVVTSGSTVQLICEYEHSTERQDPLYSIKWYRNVNQFYEYIPNRNPRIRIYDIPQVNVDQERSSEASVWLQNLTRAASGTYRCEVMSDKPLFETDDKAANMTVVDIPAWGPEVSGVIKGLGSVPGGGGGGVEVGRESLVRPGDVVVGRCVMGRSDPPADVVWRLNSLSLPPQAHMHKLRQMNLRGRHAQISEIEVSVEDDMLVRGTLVLSCEVRVDTVFERQANLTLLHADHVQIAGFGRYSSGSSSRASLMLLLVPVALLPFCCSYYRCFSTCGVLA